MADETCFVIMGFGKKTDYSEKGARTLDLDATYQAIIKPAVEGSGLRCIRADEVKHSGVIDRPMYELLLRADLVIADISTANANALYELGVRHALRPFATIVMKEEEGKFHFDLNHLATFQYRHLGEDIGAREAATKTAALKALIKEVRANRRNDSPVFEFLAALGLKPMSDEELERNVKAVQAAGDTLASALDAGRAAAKTSDHKTASLCFRRALERQTQAPPGGGPKPPADAFIVQQLALATYKAKEPTAVDALRAGWDIIQTLTPAESTDPETLGIAGAIQKRLWEQLKVREHLDKAVEFYGRGFELKRDYYNGENYALCLDLRAAAAQATAPDEATYDRMTARRVRPRIYEQLSVALRDPATAERSDYRWMLATMANTAYALGKSDEAADYEGRFRAVQPAEWEIDTFEQGKKYAIALAAAAP